MSIFRCLTYTFLIHLGGTAYSSTVRVVVLRVVVFFRLPMSTFCIARNFQLLSATHELSFAALHARFVQLNHAVKKV